MKRLIVCCDGTWQDLSRPYPTNVVKIAQVIKPSASDGTRQIVYYQDGLGTRDEFDKITGGAFGWGIDIAIQEAYRFLCLNYEDGDEIYLFGFSRGAYTVRSLAGFIYCSGLLNRQHIRKLPEAYKLYRDRAIPPSHPRAQEFRYQHGKNVPIKLLGCWDTVGELGVPNQIPFVSNWINAKYKFHDIKVNRRIENALHAVAIDERHAVFNVTPMRISDGAKTKLRQVWFPGTHGCIGGGDKETSGLSDAALQWMMDETKELKLGLEFVNNPQDVAEGGIAPNYEVAFDNRVEGIEVLGGTIDRNILNPDNDSTDSTIFNYDFFDNHIHLSTKRRWKLTHEPLYRPNNLSQYKQWFDAFVDQTSASVQKSLASVGVR